MSEDKKIGVIGSLGTRQFVPASYILIDNEQIGLDLKGLYILLCRFKNKNSRNKCWPSLSKIEKLSGWSTKTILKKLDLLEEFGLIKKISNIYNSKQNNEYILFDPEIVLGMRQLTVNDMTDDEREYLNSLDQNLIIRKADNSIVICATEKCKFFLQIFYKTLDRLADSLVKDLQFAETKVVIEEIQQFYESIATRPVVFLSKQVTEDTEKISSEEFLELLKTFNINDIIEIVREIDNEGVPSQFKEISKSSYILSILWARRKTLSSSIVDRVININKTASA